MSIPTAKYTNGDTFLIQFAWRLPNDDYLRTVFEASVLDIVPSADKYIVRLNKLVAGRQESSNGEIRSRDVHSPEYWSFVGKLVGNKIQVAFEVQDGRAVHMRLATLTGEHNFFFRYENLGKVSEKVKKLLENKESYDP